MAVFDAEATKYDQWYETKLGRFVDEVETKLAFSLFLPKPGMKILDVGCGTGNFSIKLAKMGCEVVGIDISDEMLTKARKKSRDLGMNIEFYNMDIYDLKFEEETFDGVFSMAAFEFIKEPQKAYEEMFRVLKKNGELLIGTIHRDSSWGSLYMSDEFQKNTVFKYASFKSMEELTQLDSKRLKAKGECLFIPPNAPDEVINMEQEREYSKKERGGYICALWKKED